MNDFVGVRWAMMLAATVCLAGGGCRDRPTAVPAPTAARGKTVQLVIDFGDGGQKRFPAIAWRDRMTVLDALDAAKAIPHGITFSSRGSGEAALVTQIDDVANQAGAVGAKNWLFYINDKLAKQSCGVATIQAGDSVLWKFEPYVE